MQYLKRVSRLAALLVSVCFLIGCQTKEIENNIVDTATQEKPFAITRFDKEVQWQEGKEIDISRQQEQITIVDGGAYLITGKCSGGIIVDAEDQNVHLFLDNVAIETKTGPAIWVRSAGKVVITLVDGSTNIISDYPSLEEGENADAALFCVTDLTINGHGDLEIYGYHKDAIYSKDVLKILGGNITVRSKNDGIRGSDGVVLAPDSMSVESEKTGVRTNNTGKSGKGSIDISGGNIEITAGEYGIRAAADLYIEGANVICQGVVEDIFAEGKKYIKSECIN